MHNNIISSIVHDGKFYAVSYGPDLNVWRLMYPNKSGSVTTQRGPFVNTVEVHQIDDVKLIEKFNDDVVEKLKQFAETHKNKAKK